MEHKESSRAERLLAGYAVGVSAAFAVLALFIAIALGGRFSIGGMTEFFAGFDRGLLTFSTDDYGNVDATGRKQGTFKSKYQDWRRRNPASFEDIGEYPAGSSWRRYERSVGELDICYYDDDRGKYEAASCTASIIASDLILTARHCIRPKEYDIPGLVPKHAVFLLGFVAVDGMTQEPNAFAVNVVPIEEGEKSGDLDYAVLRADFNAPLENSSISKCAQDKLLAKRKKGAPPAIIEPVTLAAYLPEKGDRLFLVHHPIKTPLVVSSHNCKDVGGKPDDGRAQKSKLYHKCDTLPGSSGAPVFSVDRNAVVAIHSSGRELGAAFSKSAENNSAVYIAAIAEHSRKKNLHGASKNAGLVASVISQKPLDNKERERLLRFVAASEKAYAAKKFALSEQFALAAFTEPFRSGDFGEDDAGSLPKDALPAQAALIRAHLANRNAALVEDKDGVAAMDLSPDGSRIVIMTSSGAVKIWEIDGSKIRTIHAAEAGTIANYAMVQWKSKCRTKAAPGSLADNSCQGTIAFFNGELFAAIDPGSGNYLMREQWSPEKDGMPIALAWRSGEMRIVSEVREVNADLYTAPEDYAVWALKPDAGGPARLPPIPPAATPLDFSPDAESLLLLTGYGRERQLLIRNLGSGRDTPVALPAGWRPKGYQITWSPDRQQMLMLGEQEVGEDSKRYSVANIMVDIVHGKSSIAPGRLGVDPIDAADWREHPSGTSQILASRDDGLAAYDPVSGRPDALLTQPESIFVAKMTWRLIGPNPRIALLSSNSLSWQNFRGRVEILDATPAGAQRVSAASLQSPETISNTGMRPVGGSAAVTKAAVANDGKRILMLDYDGRWTIWSMMTDDSNRTTVFKSAAFEPRRPPPASSPDVCDCFRQAFSLSASARSESSAEFRGLDEQCSARFGLQGAEAVKTGRNARLIASPLAAMCSPSTRTISASWIPGQDAFVTTANDGSIRIWRLSSDPTKISAQLLVGGGSSASSSVAASPPDLTDGRPLPPWRQPFIFDSVVSESGHAIATRDSFGKVDVYRMADGQKIFELKPAAPKMSSSRPAGQTKTIESSSSPRDSPVGLFPVETFVDDTDPNEVSSIAWYGNQLATGHFGGSIKIWDLKSSKVVSSHEIGRGQIIEIVPLSDQGRLIANVVSGSSLWNTRAQTEIAFWNARSFTYQPVRSAPTVVNPDGRLAIRNVGPNGSRIQDLETGEVIDVRGVNAWFPLAFHWDSNRSRLMIVTPHGAEIWDVPPFGKELRKRSAERLKKTGRTEIGPETCIEYALECETRVQ